MINTNADSDRSRDPATGLTWQVWVWLVGAAAISILGFIISSRLKVGAGFPLDDAWIHQTYARNLAYRGEWAFVPGQPSAGSTAPLWSLLIAIGYYLGIDAIIWTYFFGAVSLIATAACGEMIVRKFAPGWKPRLPWVGIFLVFEWHLVWAAVSGMETVSFALAILGSLLILTSQSMNWFVIGVLIGTSVWLRPDGVMLLGPAFLVLFTRERIFRKHLWQVGEIIVGFSLLVLPYLLFNYYLSGSWLPNTFYAKQAEYAVVLLTPFSTRLLSMVSLPMIGAGSLLIPGVILAVWRGVEQRQWVVLACALWWFGYTVVYALRLPLDYQHGRYLMPAMPVFFTLGIIGMVWLLRKDAQPKSRMWYVIQRAWVWAVVGVTIGFYVMGARAYASDVAIIETEVVRAAKWVAENTAEDALVAAHDIGALGYFAKRPLIDLAGLVSPEVIPFIRDEGRLAEYLDQSKADYLVTFPSWYPELVARSEVLYTTEGKIILEAGGENMAVYRWQAENR